MDNIKIKTEKLYKYGKKQLSAKGLETEAKDLREVLDDIANIEAGTTGGDYDIVKITKPNGNQKWIVTTVTDGERPKDMLQQLLDGGRNCNQLCQSYQGTELDLSRLDTTKVTNMSSMFSSCKKLTSLDVSNLNTLNVTNMNSMFQNCSSLTSLDVSNLNTLNVTDMGWMFYGCSGLTSLDVSNFNTINVTTMRFMFQDCNALTSLDLSRWNTSNVTNMNSMFSGCKKLTSLDVSNFDTSKVTDMYSMFSSCSNLETLDLSNFNTSKVTDMYSMFMWCGSINILGCLDMISVTRTDNMFTNCRELVNITLKNIKISLRLKDCTKLSDNTIINTFQELWDLTGGTTQTLTLSTPSNERTEAIYVKLIEPTEEMIANDPYITSKKPCVVCESTDAGAMTLKEYGISKNWNIA